jgi:hypothetical protein
MSPKQQAYLKWQNTEYRRRNSGADSSSALGLRLLEEASDALEAYMVAAVREAQENAAKQREVERKKPDF